MSQIKLHLDVVEGTLDLECSGEDFEGIMTRIEGMMRNLTNVPRRKMADVHVAPEDAEQEITEASSLLYDYKRHEYASNNTKMLVLELYDS